MTSTTSSSDSSPVSESSNDQDLKDVLAGKFDRYDSSIIYLREFYKRLKSEVPNPDDLITVAYNSSPEDESIQNKPISSTTKIFQKKFSHTVRPSALSKLLFKSKPRDVFSYELKLSLTPYFSSTGGIEIRVKDSSLRKTAESIASDLNNQTGLEARVIYSIE